VTPTPQSAGHSWRRLQLELEILERRVLLVLPAGLPSFSDGNKPHYYFIFFNASRFLKVIEFPSFCVADGFKTNLSYLKVLSFS